MAETISKGTILCIDDDDNLRLVMTQYLQDEGYRVLNAESAATAMEKVDTSQIHVILLDLVLPDGEGLSLIPQFKNNTDAGIIVVSGKNDTTEKIVCIEMGADDYITKPFEMRELAARIKAVLRRIEPSNDKEDSNGDKGQNIIFGDGWTLDRGQYQLFNKDGDSVDLTTGEFQLLEALIMAPNRALTREHLFDLTRDGQYDAYDRAIDIQVARLRKKLSGQGSSSDMIKTVRGVGYMFIGKRQTG